MSITFYPDCNRIKRPTYIFPFIACDIPPFDPKNPPPKEVTIIVYKTCPDRNSKFCPQFRGDP